MALCVALSACAAEKHADELAAPAGGKEQPKMDKGDDIANSRLETITLGAGCFWCTEAVFQHIKGVRTVTVGYMGGSTDKPTYKQVCSGRTGHAEVAQIRFDPAEVSLDGVLDVFWKTHDPTQMNRQGADVGTQYRSAIFYHTEAQRPIAEASKARHAAAVGVPLVTEITPARTFFEAEDYHQDYFANNPNAPYCQMVIVPKLRKLK